MLCRVFACCSLNPLGVVYFYMYSNRLSTSPDPIRTVGLTRTSRRCRVYLLA
jgi:hypothetical protein